MPPAKKDFDVSELVKSDQHEKDMGALDRRVSLLENRVGTSEKIAETLFEASQKAVKMKTMIGSLLTDLIQRDRRVRIELQNFIKESDRDAVKVLWKRFGFLIWSSVVYIIGVITTVIIQKNLK